MRIVVNDVAASSGGALTILQSFHRYVSEFDQDNEWVFLLGSDLLEESPRIRTVVLSDVKKSWLRRLLFDFFTGRKLIARLKPDAVLSLQNTYTYGVACPQVIYVHQPLPFQPSKSFSLWRRGERSLAVYQHLVGAIIKQSIRRADQTIVQTRWMREAVLAQTGITPNRIESILPDLDNLGAYVFDGSPNPGSFFYPTGSTSYKNNQCIYAACHLLRQQGVSDFQVTMTIDPPVPDPNVIPIGRIQRGEVLGILSRSVLIFPSLIETYGLPLAEARALDSVVLAADLPYAREVLSGYENAFFFDPKSPLQLAALMSAVMSGSIVRVHAAQSAELPRSVPGTASWAKVMEILKLHARDWHARKGGTYEHASESVPTEKTC